MLDVAYIAGTVAFFVLAALFGRALDRIGREHIGSEDHDG